MIRPGSDIVPLDKRTPGVAAIQPLLFPKLDMLYSLREARLRAIAEQPDRDDGAYFRFLAYLVHAQAHLLAIAPLDAEACDAIRSVIAHGDADTLLDSRLLAIASWQDAFLALTQAVAPHLGDDTQALLKDAAQNPAERARQAACLLRGEYGQVDAGLAVLLWAALSLCWAQAMNRQDPAGFAVGEASACPCCGAPPVGSLVLGGDREGLRYLQCSLCETRWHRVRGICVTCGASGQIDHWSLDDLKAPVQVETCGDCLSSLKVMRFDYDPALEMVADDLGSFLLDNATAEQGFIRSTLSPFSFPGQG